MLFIKAIKAYKNQIPVMDSDSFLKELSVNEKEKIC